MATSKRNEQQASLSAHRLRYHAWGGREVLALEPQDRPSRAAGDLLVRVEAAGLNPKDVLVRLGRFRRLSGPPPITPGFDFCGIVAEAPSGGPEPGTRVFGMLGGMHGGAVASWLTVPANRVIAAPEGFDPATLAAAPLAGLTALQALRDLGRVQAGSAVCINGATGGVGSFAIQIARLLGAAVTTLSSERNLELCRDLGAHSTLRYDDPGALVEREFDVFFDVYGNRSFGTMRRRLAGDGTYVTTVPSARNLRDHLLSLPSLGRRSRLVVVRHRDADLAWLRDHLASGALRPLVDSVFPLDRAVDAFERLETRHARGKVVVRVTGEPAEHDEAGGPPSSTAVD